jgi:uncharacterized protein (DUF58 family)
MPAAGNTKRVEGRRMLSLAAPGRWLAGTALTLAVVGLAVGQPVIMAWGLSGLVAVLWAIASGRSMLHQVRQGELTVVLEPEVSPLRLSVDDVVEVPFRLEGDACAGLVQAEVMLSCEGGITAQVHRAASGLSAHLSGQQVGYGWLQGAQLEAKVAGGMVSLNAWLPINTSVTVLPRRFPLTRGVRLRSTRPSQQERAGLGRSRRRGFGLELRELRDHLPGDSFRHIAWAASARRGRLVTREFESDTMVSAWILVDVSPSMYWGAPGKARIDFALEVAFSISTSLSGRGDRVGVLLYDDRVRAAVAPRRGRGQGARILEVLLEAHHLLHEERTELTERELLESVAQWFNAQEQRTFNLPWGSEPGTAEASFFVDDRGLHEAVTEHLERHRSERPGGRFVLPVDDYARGERHASYRAFCRHVGIPLPLDPTSRRDAQAHGFEAAVQFVLRSGGGPHTMLMLSDLYAVDDVASLRRAAIAARRHRHNIVVLSPSDPGFVVESLPAQDTALGEALEAVATLQARHSLADVESVLKPAGVTIVSCSPDEAMTRVLQHLDRVA